MTTYNVLDNYGLHQCAFLGDEEGVRRALRDGADVNALDAAGRTAVMCAVSGENWQDLDACDASFMSPKRISALKTLLSHPDISLLTLNSPHPFMNGVIPLCMAAWLNQPQAVRTLLDVSVDTVSVDGMDAHGATALMYAARDGNLEVAQILLSHGARSDFRDRNHRTSIQFALSHPQVLWLCETMLRRHRWRESKSADRTRLSADTEKLVDLTNASISLLEDLQPPPLAIFTPEASSRLTNTLISCIRQGDLSFIHSLLFAPAVNPASPPAQYPMSVPALVNIPDSKGWSLVHHCVAVPRPSIDILDALYCAGADVSLFTVNEKCAPLHILARSARPSYENPDATHSLHDFCLHLIQDLRAPLSAKDGDEETCIHIAAEHGHSADLLVLFLDCDTTGAVRKMKNSRGLTPLEVAKTEFLYAFGIENSGPRPTSALSNRTVRPTDSFASLSSISELQTFPLATTHDSSSIFTPDIDVDYTVQQLLLNLRATSLSVSHPATTTHIQEMEDRIDDASDQANAIVVHFRARIEEATKIVQELHKAAERIESVRSGVVVATSGKLLLRGITPVQSRRRNRDSEDSQLTFVDNDNVTFDFPTPPRTPLPTANGRVSAGTQTALLDLYVGDGAASMHSAAALLDRLTPPTSPTSSVQMSCLWEIERELKALELPVEPTPAEVSPTKAALRLKHVMKKRRKLEERLLDIEAGLYAQKKDPASPPARLKAWFRRFVTPAQPAPAPVIVHDLRGECNVGREVRAPPQPAPRRADADAIIDGTLRTSKVVLEAAQRDLASIAECLQSAEQFIDLANHSISRTQRVVKRAIKKREQMIADLRTAAVKASEAAVQSAVSPALLGYEHALAARPSMASISTIYSVSSSVSSVAATLTENDDEDIRVVRRLLLRKIEAQTSGAWDEVDRVTGWLQIVKEAVRSVKRRAYL